MSTDTTVSNLIINKLTKAQYDAATKNPTELYYVTDDDTYQEKLTAGTGVDITNNIIKSVGVENVNGGTIVKTWTGTKAQYDAIVTKDADTIYNITDDTLLADFANTSLSNLTNAGKIVGAGLGMPSTTHDVLSWPATGTNVTAPSDGWFFARRSSDGSNTGVTLLNQTTGVIAEAQHAGGTPSVFVPAAKGDTVTLYWLNGASTNSFWFVYAEGSKSEAN